KGNYKKEFISNANLKKISAIITEKKIDLNVPQIIVSDVQIALAILSREWFGNPQKKLKIIGITGTKGKTSAAYILFNLLQHQLGKRKIALFSTVETFLGNDEKTKSHLTTPESYELFKNMKKAVDNGAEILIMEVSSQAYLKNRVYGITFDVGMFLNISEDHIGPNEHKNFDDYLSKKQQLAYNSKIMLVNNDSEYASKFLGIANKDITIGESNSEFTYQILKSNLEYSLFKINNQVYELLIPGDFNVTNAVFAIVAAKCLGIDFNEKILPIKNIPGRMLEIKSENNGLIVIDYAHNYESLHRLLEFLKKNHPDGKVIVVLGSPGNKGTNRRSGFAKALDEFANIVFLTSDDPGFENPLDIANEIKRNILNTKIKVEIELDRRKAIYAAIGKSTNNDVVVLAAKGEDLFQKINGVDTPYDGDYRIALNYLNK
ncbi:MAG: UDP-N-acetylmuramoyl-L-alanyl-D-glutamate--2,6-diaminopimelate ligase, partial [Lactobacillaceae bacterium]|nr:UDP-N-acetylmuramoyl-L-alanyl-D-glutamate--2,6-diaminopimelate ligase [Lactobacillaceae bacterium]